MIELMAVKRPPHEKHEERDMHSCPVPFTVKDLGTTFFSDLVQRFLPDINITMIELMSEACCHIYVIGMC